MCFLHVGRIGVRKHKAVLHLLRWLGIARFTVHGRRWGSVWGWGLVTKYRALLQRTHRLPEFEVEMTIKETVKLEASQMT